MENAKKKKKILTFYLDFYLFADIINPIYFSFFLFSFFVNIHPFYVVQAAMKKE